MRKITKSDEATAKLIRGVDTFADLYKLLDKVATGPAKIMIRWNEGLIKGWQKANDGLLKIDRLTTCQDIIVYSMDSKNREFFEKLAEARGCPD